jgi:pimeloyl-ACP methyl ester carboxylesterase
MSLPLASLPDILDEVAAELEERLPGYLRRQPLRFWSSDPLAAACARVACTWELPFAKVADEQALTAVDRYLRARLAELAPDARPGAVATTAALTELCDARALLALRQRRQDERAAARARVAALGQALDGHAAGPHLRYTAAGAAGEPPIVLLNALGQEQTAWLPLVEHLARRRRVVLWQMRAEAADGLPVTFAEHAADVRQILDAERAASCHLVGWCTGARLAVRASRLAPQRIRSIVMLGGSFKHPGRPRGLDTRYEQNLEAMLRAVAAEPALADRLRGLLAAAAAAPVELDHLDAAALAEHALTAAPAALASAARHPFRSAAALVTYARQHLELWAQDELAAAAAVAAPVLGLSGERDQLVAPAALAAAVARFPVGRFEQIAGATHYALYERPRCVAERIEKWIGNAQECAAASPASVVG